ncbi:MAG: hypothetical protein ACI8RD_011507, partial [Bacillariaceae sp.]
MVLVCSSGGEKVREMKHLLHNVVLVLASIADIKQQLLEVTINNSFSI